MSGKMGKRETGRKPIATRRHDSLTAGAFGHESIDQIRFGDELNRKISGTPSKEHSKYKNRPRKATS
jgi:hypothetical protein